MPSFFGYLGWSAAVLLPLFLACTWLFFCERAARDRRRPARFRERRSRRRGGADRRRVPRRRLLLRRRPRRRRSDSRRGSTRASARVLRARPRRAKARDRAWRAAGARGAAGSRSAASSPPGVPDRKEGLYFGAELGAGPSARARAARRCTAPNLFPRRSPGLREAVLAYIAALTRARPRADARASRSSLGLAESLLRASATPPTRSMLFRIFHYPPPTPATSATWGVGEHTDYGLLTILLQDDAGGLEVQTPRRLDRRRRRSRARFVCNIGDMLDRMTGGRYRSTPHRVRNRSGARPAARSRSSSTRAGMRASSRSSRRRRSPRTATRGGTAPASTPSRGATATTSSRRWRRCSRRSSGTCCRGARRNRSGAGSGTGTGAEPEPERKVGQGEGSRSAAFGAVRSAVRSVRLGGSALGDDDPAALREPFRVAHDQRLAAEEALGDHDAVAHLRAGAERSRGAAGRRSRPRRRWRRSPRRTAARGASTTGSPASAGFASARKWMRTLMSGRSTSSGSRIFDLDLERALLAVHLRVELHDLRGVAPVRERVGHDLGRLARGATRARSASLTSTSARRSSRFAMRIRSPEPAKPPGTAISPTSFSFARITPSVGRAQHRVVEVHLAPARSRRGARRPRASADAQLVLLHVELGLRGDVLAAQRRGCARSPCGGARCWPRRARGPRGRGRAPPGSRGRRAAPAARPSSRGRTRRRSSASIRPGDAHADRDVLVAGDDVARAREHRRRGRGGAGLGALGVGDAAPRAARASARHAKAAAASERAARRAASRAAPEPPPPRRARRPAPVDAQRRELVAERCAGPRSLMSALAQRLDRAQLRGARAPARGRRRGRSTSARASAASEVRGADAELDHVGGEGRGAEGDAAERRRDGEPERHGERRADREAEQRGHAATRPGTRAGSSRARSRSRAACRSRRCAPARRRTSCWSRRRPRRCRPARRGRPPARRACSPTPPASRSTRSRAAPRARSAGRRRCGARARPGRRRRATRRRKPE